MSTDITISRSPSGKSASVRFDGWRTHCIRWAPLALVPSAVWLLLPISMPRWERMWLFALAIYVGCKWLTWWPIQPNVSVWRHIAYLLAWPGMDTRAFLNGRIPESKRPDMAAWLFAGAKLAIGIGLVIYAATLVDFAPWLVVGWLGMIGVALSLHFGLFGLLSVFWRNLGIDARPMMDWPPLSTSVSQYWGRRWNTAFRDLAHRFVFQPATRRVGGRFAMLGVFLVSGLVHDLVISLPAGAGFGGPTLFFLAQAGGAIMERSPGGHQLGLGRGWRGWFFAMVVVFAPLPLLFHPPFISAVVLPMLRGLKAIL